MGYKQTLPWPQRETLPSLSRTVKKPAHFFGEKKTLTFKIVHYKTIPEKIDEKKDSQCLCAQAFEKSDRSMLNAFHRWQRKKKVAEGDSSQSLSKAENACKPQGAAPLTIPVQ